MENTAGLIIDNHFGLVVRRACFRDESKYPSLRGSPKGDRSNLLARRLPACRQGRLRRPETSGLLATTNCTLLPRFVISMIVFTMVVILISGCAEKQDSKTAESSVKNVVENITQQVETFTLSSLGDDGESNWQLEGDSADIAEDNINLKNVRIKSQSKDASVTMKAKTGLIKKREDRGIFKEDVVLAYDDGTTLATDEIDWSFKKQTAKTDGSVLVKSGALETKAEGACLTKGINQIQLNRNISMKTDSGTVIKCSGPLILDYKKNVAFFNKDVKIDNSKGSMMSEKMVVFFDPAKKKVQRVEASGGVRLIRGNSVSMSEKAVYFTDEGKAVLTGNPVVFVDQEEARKASKEL